MGRTAAGVRGMRLAEGEGEQDGARVVSLIVVDGDGDILTASEHGYGKRTPLEEYPCKGRGIQGVIALKTTDRNGELVGAIQLSDHHEVLLISDRGTLVRTRASEISQVSRNTQGVTLIRLGQDESLQAIERIDVSLEEEDEMLTGPVVPVEGDEVGIDRDVLTVAGHDPDAIAPVDDEPA
jgi:DNA gyrase subunit A